MFAVAQGSTLNTAAAGRTTKTEVCRRNHRKAFQDAHHPPLVGADSFPWSCPTLVAGQRKILTFMMSARQYVERLLQKRGPFAVLSQVCQHPCSKFGLHKNHKTLHDMCSKVKLLCYNVETIDSSRLSSMRKPRRSGCPGLFIHMQMEHMRQRSSRSATPRVPGRSRR